MTGLVDTVGVIGLGKLGLVYAATLVEQLPNVTVMVYDHSPAIEKDVRAGRIPAHIDPGERGLRPEQIAGMVWATPRNMERNCGAVFICVPTPSLPTGRFDSHYIEDALRDLGPIDHGAVIGVVSTVSPGTFAGRLGPQWGVPLVYCPALIALGHVMRGLTRARAFILGHDPARRGADVIRTLLEAVNPGAVPLEMSYASAELAKLAINLEHFHRAAYANELGWLAEDHGADVEDVLRALTVGMPQAVGTAGGSVGGPCLPRDALAYTEAGGMLGETLTDMNQHHVLRTAAMVGRGRARLTYAVLGRGYRQGVDYRIESFGDAVAEQLDRWGLIPATDVSTAAVVVLAMPGQDISQINPDAYVLDPWGTHAVGHRFGRPDRAG